MMLKMKNLGPSIDLKEGRRERAIAQATETGEGEEDTYRTLA